MAKKTSAKRKAPQVNLDSGSEGEIDFASFQKKIKPTARSTFTPVVGTSAPTQLRTSAPAPSGVPPTPRETPRQDGFVFSMPSTKQGLSTKTPSKSSKPALESTYDEEEGSDDDRNDAKSSGESDSDLEALPAIVGTYKGKEKLPNPSVMVSPNISTSGQAPNMRAPVANSVKPFPSLQIVTQPVVNTASRQSRMNSEREVDRISMSLEEEKSEGSARDKRLERLTQRADGHDTHLQQIDGRLQGMEDRITLEIRGMKDMLTSMVGASHAQRARTATPTSAYDSPVSATFPPLQGDAFAPTNLGSGGFATPLDVNAGQLVLTGASVLEPKGDMKPWKIENIVKAFLLEVFYGFLGITSSDPAPPPYLAPNGTPDYFPKECMQNGATVARPNWEKAMKDQLAWWPLLFQRIMSTIPSNDLTLTAEVQKLPEHVLYNGIKNGPFRTVSRKWKQLKHTPAEVEELRRLARVRTRKAEKIASRGGLRPEIESLGQTTWDFLFHSEYASDEGTDDEQTDRRISVRQPESRAVWVNVLFASMLAKAGMNVCGAPQANRSRPRLAIKCPGTVPALRRSSGPELIIKIPICAFSKMWLKDEANKGLLQASHHLIDWETPNRPDVSDFVNTYPPISNVEATETEATREEAEVDQTHNEEMMDEVIGLGLDGLKAPDNIPIAPSLLNARIVPPQPPPAFPQPFPIPGPPENLFNPANKTPNDRTSPSTPAHTLHIPLPPIIPPNNDDLPLPPPCEGYLPPAATDSLLPLSAFDIPAAQSLDGAHASTETQSAQAPSISNPTDAPAAQESSTPLPKKKRGRKPKQQQSEPVETSTTQDATSSSTRKVSTRSFARGVR